MNLQKTADQEGYCGGEITVRDIRFDFANVQMNWHGAGVGVTGLFDALSASFPQGEAFFIRVIKRAAASIDDAEIQDEVRGFIGQESIHAREHRVFNNTLSSAGFDVAAMESAQAKTIAWIERQSDEDFAIGVVACMEHMTAVLAAQLASDDAYLAHADEAVRDLWVWHSLEEIEHGAVAFDVMAARKRGYFFRAWLMVISTWMLLEITLRNYRIIMKTNRAEGRSRGAMRELLKFLLLSPGLMRRMAVPHLRWFAPGFHPSQTIERSNASRHLRRFDLRAKPSA